jgi:exodeoxyribonuclease-3
MKLLTWNIQHGGGTRLARFVEETPPYDADVIALTELRDRPGTALRAALLYRGGPICPTGNASAATRQAAEPGPPENPPPFIPPAIANDTTITSAAAMIPRPLRRETEAREP